MGEGLAVDLEFDAQREALPFTGLGAPHIGRQLGDLLRRQAHAGFDPVGSVAQRQLDRGVPGFGVIVRR